MNQRDTTEVGLVRRAADDGLTTDNCVGPFRIVATTEISSLLFLERSDLSEDRRPAIQYPLLIRVRQPGIEHLLNVSDSTATGKL